MANTVIGASGYPWSSTTISTTTSSFSVVGTNGSTSGSYLYSTGTSTNWANLTISSNGNMGIGSSVTQGIRCDTDAVFNGDIKWKGRSLGKLLESIEDRLAILTEPDPAKLEKFAALKKAYEHYKLMEKLIGDE
jgi:hypothetical protein